MYIFRHIFLFLLVSIACAAQAQVKISGKVTNEENEPIEFATVRIAGTAIGVNTNLDGAYSLSVASRDTIEVVFNCLGYKELKRQLVKPKGNLVLNVRMLKSNQQLGELQVTEFKKQTNSMQALDASKINLMPTVGGNGVESLITTMAGVSSKNEMSSQYMVRGGSYDENSVYINGIEVYRPQLISSGQQEGLSIINSDMVASVNFSTGGFNAEFGDRMSSVLDITYREPEKFEGAASLSLQGASAAIGQNTGNFSQLHGMRYKRNTSLLGSLEEKGEYDPQFFDYQTNLNLRIGKKIKIGLLGNIAINDYRFTPENRSTSFGTSNNAKQFTVYFDGQEKDRFETYFGALTMNYRHNKSSDFSALASAYLTNELVSYDISGEYWLDKAGTNGENAVGGELGVGKYHEHARTRLKMGVINLGLRGNTSINYHNLTYGVNFVHENIHDRQREWELRDSAGYSLPVQADGVNVVYNLMSRNNLSSNRFSFFAQDTYKVQSQAGLWVINGGVRCSYWDYNKQFLVSPRASVGFVPKFNERFSIRVAAGMYYQMPFYKEYREEVADADGNTIIQLNPNIKAQRSIHLIAGTDYSFRAMERPFKLSAELYYKNLADLIPYEINNLKMVYSGRNETDGYIAGLDVKFFGQFVPGTDSWLSFSLMKTQETLNGVKVPRPTDQRYSFAMFFTDFFPKFPKVKFNLRAIYSDGLPTTAPRSTRDQGYFRTPAYKRIDIGASYQLVGEKDGNASSSSFLRHFKSVWLGLDVFNLLDIANVSNYYWVTDVNDMQYAVPNYLTRRQINVRLSVNF